MGKDRKLTARINPFITLLLLLPAVIFGKHAYDGYQRIKTGVTAEDQSYYYVYTALGRYSYLKKAVLGTRDYSGRNAELKQADELLQSVYASSVEQATGFHREQRWMFFILLSLSIMFSVFAIGYPRIAYAELSKDKLTLRLPPMRRKTTTRIADIRSIRAESAIPYLPAHTDISKVNWRDNVRLVERNGDATVVSPLIFPGFHKILEKAVAKNPKIKTT